ncbi:Isoprenylcysteine carboxyl methyltransferase (ICMT) family protein [compost metagenome]
MTNAPSRPSFPKFVLTLVSQLVYPILIVGLSGDWRWVAGWTFGLWFSFFCILTITYLYFQDPALLAERSRRPGSGGEPVWDRYATAAIFVFFFAWLVLMPLDAKRFHWSEGFPLGLQVLGGVLLLLSSFLMFRAVADNTFASSLVRIQEERGQTVISSGVYRIVRHPMYLGAVCMTLGAPLLLGSRLGLMLSPLVIGVLILRIIGEERLLADQLEGYDAYRRKVRYRLIPWVW